MRKHLRFGYEITSTITSSSEFFPWVELFTLIILTFILYFYFLH